MNHAIICLKEEMRALQDARRQVLLDPDELGPLAGQILREIKDLKHAIEVLRDVQTMLSREPIRYAGFDPTEDWNTEDHMSLRRFLLGEAEDGKR
jgi:hypothetical protein